MIEVQQVNKFFGNIEAVQNISFSVAAGETLILLGTSGCGKTTTLRMINRLIEPSSGMIMVNGQPINQFKPEILRRNMGYVLQHTGLFPHFTIAENLAIVPKLLKWSGPRIKSRMVELITKVHLTEDYLQLYPRQLSGGQQQRVGLARALMADPAILLLDEPFGALDPITRASIRDLFLQIDELKSKTMVMVTHDVQEAFALGDRICLMNEGQIEQIGTPAELLFQPQTPFVEQFLNEQRLLLELKAIKIAENIQSNSATDLTALSLWDSFTLLMQENKIPVQSQINKVNQRPVYSVPLDALIQAFQNLRKS